VNSEKFYANYEYLTYDDVNIVPDYSYLNSRTECNVSCILSNIKLQIPILSSPMDTITESDMAIKMNELGGLGIIHRFMSIEDQINQIKILMNNNLTNIAIAVGVKEFEKDRIQKIIQNGANIILIDIAHGHHKLMETTIKFIKDLNDKITIIAGNVSTPDAVRYLKHWGADIIRVGIGGGSLCETRIRTGVGMPMISTLLNIRNYFPEIPLIADGGIRYAGDVAKALAAGANTVMLGSMLSGTRETPGTFKRVGEFPNEELFKEYRGSASQSSKIQRGESDINIEGNSIFVKFKGKTDRIINGIIDGLKSAMSYVGSKDLNEFYKYSKFVRVTFAGQIEAHPHLLKHN